MLKNRLVALTGVATVLAFGSLLSIDPTSQQDAQVKATATTEDEKQEMIKLSEAFGHFIGRNLNSPGMKFDLEAIIRGMREGAAGKPAPMSDKDYEALLMKMQEKAFTEVSDNNLKTANEFLEKNKSSPNVKEIEPNKLQYEILKEGTGPAVTETDAPMINYTGQYADETTFGSSEDTGGPVTIPLSQTIPGFSKGILGMKEGEKRRLFVHPDLGYGTMGQLLPNSLLIFDIEVVKANNPDHAQGQDGDLQGLSELDDEDNEDEDDEDNEDDDKAKKS